MGAAVALRDVVGEGQHVFVVAVVPPERDFDDDAVSFALDQDRLVDQRRLRAIEIAHERLEAALVKKLLALDLGMARIGKNDAHAGIEEGELAQAMFDRRVIELDHREGFWRGRERHLGAALGLAVRRRRRADDGELVGGVAMGEVNDMFEPVAPDAQGQRRRQRVDDGDADAMQSAGNLVGILVEFPARMQLGHDDLGRRNALLVVDPGRDAAPVVGDRARAVGIQRDGHDFGVAGERLVDRVVDDLIDHVMQSRPVIGVADIHARPFAHGIEAAQDLDRIRAIGVAYRLLFQGRIDIGQ